MQNLTPLFKIENLKCSYNGKDVVLSINDLIIPKGKFIAILGVSGAGKSTILETLGLMNKTFTNGSHVSFFDDQNKEYKFDNIWNSSRKNDIETIRNEHFSFIFQETNLMQNFTAYENVCLSQMLQGTSLEQSFISAEEAMGNIGLSEIDKSKKAFELSGGQRQRLAFVRAITPSYTVLFGDEPTGNLDEKSSQDLMAIIKSDVLKKKVSAIIVTHNIKLSEQFADIIMIITKDERMGILERKNIFIVDDSDGHKKWKNDEGSDIHNITTTIRGLL